ncbi:MAG: hypothetical protein BWY85_01631 [Firmicutes bacterium ADurb.Bin506]|nr:MAG: hypothetical protein BWY85_01631 [Firmicutes bacterium ADurb.Bin506]
MNQGRAELHGVRNGVDHGQRLVCNLHGLDGAESFMLSHSHYSSDGLTIVPHLPAREYRTVGQPCAASYRQVLACDDRLHAGHLLGL